MGIIVTIASATPGLKPDLYKTYPTYPGIWFITPREAVAVQSDLHPSPTTVDSGKQGQDWRGGSLRLGFAYPICSMWGRSVVPWSEKMPQHDHHDCLVSQGKFPPTQPRKANGLPSRLQVLIVGAGPAGQLLGLLLAKQNISVTLVEQATQLDENPRATHYGPPAMKVFDLAGVGDELRSRGFCMRAVAWRHLDGTYIAGVNHELQKDQRNRMTALPLNQLGELLYEHSLKFPSIKYLFNRRVTDIGQDESAAWVDTVHVETGEELRLEADYIVGCDGAKSVVRRSLFGDQGFPGKTWDEQIVATNVYYDFEKFGYSDANFMIDPTHWYMAAKITSAGMWRVTYGEIPGLTNEELMARQPGKYKAMLPGHPDPDQYKMVNISPYKVHQRLAEKMRVGRFLLAADAAHLCNPFGGLGLTGGIVDVGGLYECLIGMFSNKADASILDVYSDARRKKYQEVVNPISSANLLRMFSVHPDKVLDSDEFLQACKRAETDDDLAAEILGSAHALTYDFTQHYSSK
ncbi:uncharacterized protein MKZ38_001621 [Zalerion maritima]|uniref:FAD-binding domain-containing protein n=1 Tax=Zalerion maritima TaxID=339359 RepID=A0AAD5RQ26_9PEZI|nr:uncharacterized protein MKZ38_001621 [Zalerion maritima]